LTENLLDSALSYNTIALKWRTKPRPRYLTDREIWIQQGEILAKQNRAYPAIMALENAQNIEDNIASNAQRLKAERLRQEMTIRRAEKQIQQHFEAQFRREYYIRYGMFSALFLAALICLYYLFKVQIRQKANRQLKVQNAQIESQKNQLEQLSQVKDQLFAVISHDLRSPLWAIQAVLDTLDEPDLSSAERKHWLELLHQQTAKTSVMLENLLYWARIQMNSYQPSQRRIQTTADCRRPE
jgi:signal transduction histidine kinase